MDRFFVCKKDMVVFDQVVMHGMMAGADACTINSSTRRSIGGREMGESSSADPGDFFRQGLWNCGTITALS